MFGFLRKITKDKNVCQSTNNERCLYISESFERIKCNDDGSFTINGNLICKENININLPGQLYITGDVSTPLSITSKNQLTIEGSLTVSDVAVCDSLMVRQNIEAEKIRTTGSIVAFGDVKSASSIECYALSSGGNISASMFVRVTSYILGKSIVAKKEIYAKDGDISAFDGCISSDEGYVLADNGNIVVKGDICAESVSSYGDIKARRVLAKKDVYSICGNIEVIENVISENGVISTNGNIIAGGDVCASGFIRAGYEINAQGKVTSDKSDVFVMPLNIDIDKAAEKIHKEIRDSKSGILSKAIAKQLPKRHPCLFPCIEGWFNDEERDFEHQGITLSYIREKEHCSYIDATVSMSLLLEGCFTPESYEEHIDSLVYK